MEENQPKSSNDCKLGECVQWEGGLRVVVVGECKTWWACKIKIKHFYQYEYQQLPLSVVLLILPLYNSLLFFPQECKSVLYFLHLLSLASVGKVHVSNSRSNTLENVRSTSVLSKIHKMFLRFLFSQSQFDHLRYNSLTLALSQKTARKSTRSYSFRWLLISSIGSPYIHVKMATSYLSRNMITTRFRHTPLIWFAIEAYVIIYVSITRFESWAIWITWAGTKR